MKRRSFFLIIVAFFVMLLCSCGNESDKYAGRIKVTFELEGASYKNSKNPFVQYYGKYGEESLVYEPSTLPGNANNQITYPGYELLGWYTVKNENEDGSKTYENPWDFTTNTIKDNDITLYASWKKIEKCFYNVCYLDEDGNKQILGTYSTSEGGKFLDSLGYAKKRTGYTAIQDIVDSKLSVIYYDEDGNPWDSNYTHPGKDGGNDGYIDVYVKYLKGAFSFVTSFNELKTNKSRNIYLLNDIDCGGASFSFNNLDKKTIYGNGHTISNFKVQYSASNLVTDSIDNTQNTLYIGIFNKLSESTIKDLTFDNFSVEVNTLLSKTKRIVVSPIINIVSSTLDNVKFNGTYTVTKLPSNFSNDDLIFVTDKASYISDNESNVNAQVTINA